MPAGWTRQRLPARRGQCAEGGARSCTGELAQSALFYPPPLRPELRAARNLATTASSAGVAV